MSSVDFYCYRDLGEEVVNLGGFKGFIDEMGFEIKYDKWE